MKKQKYMLILGALSLGFTASSVSAEDYVTKEEFLQLQKQMTSLRQDLAAAQKQVPSSKYQALEQKLLEVEESSKSWENWTSRDMQYYRQPGKEGINVFEAPKTTDVEFDGVKLRIGGASTLQFQGIQHSNKGPYSVRKTRQVADPITGVVSNQNYYVNATLPSLTNNFNLATANLDLDLALADGVRMHLRTYLSSQHHTETYVKGGYLQVDSLDFISEDFLAGLMEHLRIKVGHMEVNYGDNHFRRSDNADSMYNPFVGNYIMDSFTTEVGAEVYYFCDDFFAMVGVTNGNLNQSTVDKGVANEPSYIGKVGFDKQIDKDLRVRLTASVYADFNSAAQYLYDGDRAGARYYNVMDNSYKGGRYSFGYDNQLVAFIVNPFVKYKGLEFYGVLETVSGEGSKGASDYSANQYAAEVLYRFGENERFYVGGRYNLVDSETAAGDDIEIDRINIGGGWFITDNILAKIEYVTQSYDGAGFDGTKYDGGEFHGIMLEGAISF